VRFWLGFPQRDRRALIAGAVVLLGALCVSFVVRPFLHARDAVRDRLGEQRELLAREWALVAASDGLPAELDSAAVALKAIEYRLFPDRDPLAATAALVSVVSDAARQQMVQVEAIETGAPEVAGVGLVAVRVDVRGRGDLEGLLRWLMALEGSRRLLRVDQLGVARASLGAPTDSADVEILTLTATVRGYVFAAADPGARGSTVARVELRQ
jgi:type II secretory pathway component PulM